MNEKIHDLKGWMKKQVIGKLRIPGTDEWVCGRIYICWHSSDSNHAKIVHEKIF